MSIILKTEYPNICAVSVALPRPSTSTTITGNNARRYAVNSAITSPLSVSGIAKLLSTSVRIATIRCFSGNNDAAHPYTSATGTTALTTWLTRRNSTRLNGCFSLPSHPSSDCDTTAPSAISHPNSLCIPPHRRKNPAASSPFAIPCTLSP